MYLSNCPTCGLLVRAGNQSCRYCAEMAATKARRELGEKAKAELEWAMVGEQSVDWEAALALSAGAHKCDEAAYRASRKRNGRDD